MILYSIISKKNNHSSSFPVLSVHHRVGISQSVSVTNDSFYLSHHYGTLGINGLIPTNLYGYRID